MNKMNKRKVLIVLGPTASGKSSFALELAKKFNGFLISADSRQVYKQMDIGTNKDKGNWKDGGYYLETKRGLKKAIEVKKVREYMVDIIDPDQEFSLDDWLKQTKQIINDNPDKLPIIVGGTGLYVSALVNDYQLQANYDPKFREKMEKKLAKKGIDYLIQKMKKYEPEIESKIQISNPRRVIRAAEIVLKTKKPLDNKVGQSEFDFLQFGVNKPREELYKRIDRRVDEMMDEGLVQEVKGLISKGYKCDSSAMSGIGYRQVCQFINNEISKEEAIRLIKRDTRRYAKRQLTWFRRDENINWVENLSQVDNSVEKFFKK